MGLALLFCPSAVSQQFGRAPLSLCLTPETKLVLDILKRSPSFTLTISVSDGSGLLGSQAERCTHGHEQVDGGKVCRVETTSTTVASRRVASSWRDRDQDKRPRQETLSWSVSKQGRFILCQMFPLRESFGTRKAERAKQRLLLFFGIYRYSHLAKNYQIVVVKWYSLVLAIRQSALGRGSIPRGDMTFCPLLPLPSQGVTLHSKNWRLHSHNRRSRRRLWDVISSGM
jgi:hypothetical protein